MLCSEENGDPSFVLTPLFIKPLSSTTCLSLDVALDGTTIAARHFPRSVQRANRAYIKLAAGDLYMFVLHDVGIDAAVWHLGCFEFHVLSRYEDAPELFGNTKPVQKCAW